MKLFAIILISLFISGCGQVGTFVRTKEGYVTLTRHNQGCRCEGTYEIWLTQGGVINNGGYHYGFAPKEPDGYRQLYYDQVSGTIEVNKVGNVISLDVYVQCGTERFRRNGSYLLNDLKR